VSKMYRGRGTARPILLYGDPVLHGSCAEVERFDPELRDLVDDMFASMYAANGVGLAANQIGVSLRVFVFDCPDETGEHRAGHVVNPVLDIPATAVPVIDEEGCLSVPGPHADLARASIATVTGVDRRHRPVTVTGTGLLARCLQHECDHLGGGVYVDLLKPRRRKKALIEAGLRSAV
jgi:peptide deformylase